MKSRDMFKYTNIHKAVFLFSRPMESASLDAAPGSVSCVWSRIPIPRHMHPFASGACG